MVAKKKTVVRKKKVITTAQLNALRKKIVEVNDLVYAKASGKCTNSYGENQVKECLKYLRKAYSALSDVY
ncbi:MAG: hypothetical protein K5860_06675 [Bacteroidales bacterium]|nr:hypothetical protein [Bacteroidales bacterium]